MATRTVQKVIVSCDQCHKDLLDDETESPALFATVYSAVEAVHDLSGECWGPWLMEHSGRALCPACRPKCAECDDVDHAVNDCPFLVEEAADA